MPHAHGPKKPFPQGNQLHKAKMGFWFPGLIDDWGHSQAAWICSWRGSVVADRTVECISIGPTKGRHRRVRHSLGECRSRVIGTREGIFKLLIGSSVIWKTKWQESGVLHHNGSSSTQSVGHLWAPHLLTYIHRLPNKGARKVLRCQVSDLCM